MEQPRPLASNDVLLQQVEALREEQDMYRRAIAQAGGAPYVLDYRTNTYTFLGDAIEELTGWPPAEFHPDRWASIIVDSRTQGDQAGLSSFEAGERTRAGEFGRWRCDLLIRRRDGSLRWLSDGSIEIFGDDGRSVGSIGLLLDIDVRKRAEDQRARHDLELKLLETQ
ncbi:MAG: hypothetical protein QOE29_1258, partial [Gaiellaceae bacterium]|nr:hypothetical protein [Gaiellaceae bacterium]